MNASGIARYLKDFDAPEPEAPAASVVGDTVFSQPESGTVDVEAERAAAYEAGRRAALAEAEARLEEELRLQDERRHHALAALTERYEGEIKAAIPSRFEALAAKLGEEISAQVAEILAPLVEKAVVERMVGRFAKVVAEAVSEGAAVTVSGPHSLFDKLAADPALAGVDLKHIATDEIDLSIETGSTLIATRLEAWTAELREALS
jgi:hypothetical protein